MNSISQFFSEIDHKILELLECAYSDFMGLSHSFKGIAKDSKNYTHFSNNIFTSLNNICHDDNIARVNDLEHTLQNSLKPNLQLNEINRSFQNFSHHTNLIKVLFMNLNQNLLTLKFLTTNIKFSDLSNQGDDNTQISELLNNIDAFREAGSGQVNAINTLTADAKKLIAEVDHITKPLNEAYSSIHLGAHILREKELHIDQHQRAVEGLSDDINQNISKIITNLQYHDIIKQKIEHISQAHKTIIDQASGLNNDQNAQEEFMSHIKDLSNIQSAILVRANQEYQQAIENISNLLKSISHDIEGITAISNKVTTSQVGNLSMPPMSILNKIYDTCTNFQELFRAEDRMLTKLGEMMDRINATCTAIINQNHHYMKLLKNIKLKENHEHLNTQINEVLADTQTICDKSNQVCHDISLLAKKVSKIRENCIQTQHNSENGENLRKNIINNYIAIINAVEQDITNIVETVNAQKKIRKNISINVQRAINGIRYYQMFEQKIIEIINMLNEMFKEIKDTSSSHEYEAFRELYTMQSEHSIHMNIIEGTHIDPDDENAGDVELF